jgi:periplasmic nitrate reductase NapD
MNISGVYVRTWPADADNVRQQLEQTTGVEVHASSKTGGLVVTVESANAGVMADIVDSFQHLDGVLSATLVYHHEEPPSPFVTATTGPLL